MANVSDIFSFNNSLYNTYVFYVCILSLKVFFVAFLTSSNRIGKKIFANPEDAKAYNVKIKTDDQVERIRRAHLNDLENIPIFIFVCGVYLLTNPSLALASNLIRLYVAARIVHTVVYAVVVVPQPARALSYTVGLLITVYMAVVTIVKFAPYM